ncbi:hypothetical protein FDP08_04000 [Marinobacter panjinensis]|uniref:Uncharacterized protein n=1 Tax=Marinobacter panjinensis TaxID=2576384 RepID=A0A4U6R1F2_9GAMM|nr:hypothetical protein [Marinobacter panjinensis]MCR8914065.1 hypothetical protein [Marinobacter panjinensis]TKV67310.1 hypothetical protein FDP08_04000 [Marinobacter panjinensis]
MATKKESAISSNDGVLRTNDVVAKHARGSPSFTARSPMRALRLILWVHGSACSPATQANNIKADKTMEDAPGLLLAESADAGEIASAFITAVAAHRHFDSDRVPST